jgi:hypothetical protein
MAFVDPERFKRFEQFIMRHLAPLSEMAEHGFRVKGRGALVYRPPNDRFDAPVTGAKFEYKTKAEIDAAQGTDRDDLIQGMLERYQPPGEALFVAIYPDMSYDVTRVVLRPPTTPGQKPN